MHHHIKLQLSLKMIIYNMNVHTRKKPQTHMYTSKDTQLFWLWIEPHNYHLERIHLMLITCTKFYNNPSTHPTYILTSSYIHPPSPLIKQPPSDFYTPHSNVTYWGTVSYRSINICTQTTMMYKWTGLRVSQLYLNCSPTTLSKLKLKTTNEVSVCWNKRLFKTCQLPWHFSTIQFLPTINVG